MAGFHARVCALAALASVWTAPVLADASSAQYRGCDGYGAASAEGDGMTEHATVLLVFNPPGYGNTARSTTDPGVAGVADCDAALADLPQRHWMRKASLLRARAMHHLDVGDATAAIADLDQADAAVREPDNALYARSLGLGMSLVRAYALRMAGDQAKADETALAAAAKRPYNRQTPLSALIAMGPQATDQDIDAASRTIARLVPTSIDELFVTALNKGRFQDAIDLYAQLAPPTEIGAINVSSERQRERDLRDFSTAESFRTAHSGAYAYALAAMGRATEARAALQAARDRLAAETQPPPPPDKSLSKSKQIDISDWNGEIEKAHTKALATGTTYLNSWAALVELRISIAEGKAEETFKQMLAKPTGRSWVTIDLLDAIWNSLPKKTRPAVPFSQTVRDQIAKSQPPKRTLDFVHFFKSLPEAETPSRVPAYEKASRGLFGNSGPAGSMTYDGWRVGDPDSDGAITVSFRSDDSTGSVVEEMALLRAAELAREQGKKGLIVVHRQDIEFTVTATMYGTPLRTDPNGFQTDLTVVLVDPAALPPKYQAAAWRVIDADDVYGKLAPIYIKPTKRR
jgi:tetratricopeptide (TPR) repeat protein